MPDIAPLPVDYAAWLAELKTRIHTAQQRASLAVNRELVLLYWQIGRDILARQGREGWGAKVIERLAQDLRNAFPDMKGFSPRNLKYMRAFAEAWPDSEFVQQAAAQLPWFHLCTLIDKLKKPEDREWYLAKAIEHNWSCNILVMQIETRLLERSGQAVSNFSAALPKPQSDLARESLKDPYRFDFLGLTDEAQEREIEHALVKHVTEFLLELGAGFAFVGRQGRSRNQTSTSPRGTGGQPLWCNGHVFIAGMGGAQEMTLSSRKSGHLLVAGLGFLFESLAAMTVN